MARAVLTTLILLAAVLATLDGTSAQEATPASEATPAVRCDVPPRSEADLAALNATPTAGATPVAMAPMAMPEGEPVDAATLNALDQTLREVKACAEAGDLARLLALYGDRWVKSVALARGPEPIVPGQPSRGLRVPVGTPSPAATAEPQVESAVKLPDGRIAASVTAGGL